MLKVYLFLIIEHLFIYRFIIIYEHYFKLLLYGYLQAYLIFSYKKKNVSNVHLNIPLLPSHKPYGKPKVYSDEKKNGCA